MSDNPRAAMLAALHEVQTAREHHARGHLVAVVGRLRRAETHLRKALGLYHNEKQTELDLSGPSGE